MHNVNQVVLNPFVTRQTFESEFTHWMFPDAELVSRTLQSVRSGNVKPGYRDGVLVVRLINCTSLFTSLVTLQEGDVLVGSFKARREGELPRVKMGIAAGNHYIKPEAAAVDVILYASKTLAEDGDNSLSPDDGNWEIVSVNGLPTVEDAPIDPMTLMYNHFHASGANDGGTNTGMTPEQFENAMRASFLYWRDKAMVLPR